MTPHFSKTPLTGFLELSIPKTVKTGPAIVIAFALFLTWRCSALAEPLFLDNFEQFQDGADLTTTNYVPATGSSVVTAVQNGSSTIKAKGFLGSTWAFFDNSVVTNKNQYKAILLSKQTAQR